MMAVLWVDYLAGQMVVIKVVGKDYYWADQTALTTAEL